MNDTLLIRWPWEKPKSLRSEGISLFIEFFKLLILRLEMIQLDEFMLPEGFDITDHGMNMFLIRIVNMDINRNNYELGKVILRNQLSDRTLPVHRRENDIYMFVYKNGLFYYHAELNKIITAVGQGSSRERFLWKYILPVDAKYPRVSSELKHHLKAKGFVPEHLNSNIIVGSALKTKVAYDIDRNKVIVVQRKIRSSAI